VLPLRLLVVGASRFTSTPPLTRMLARSKSRVGLDGMSWGALGEATNVQEDSDKRSLKERGGSGTVRKFSKGEKTQTTFEIAKSVTFLRCQRLPSRRNIPPSVWACHLLCGCMRGRSTASSLNLNAMSIYEQLLGPDLRPFT